MPVCRHKLPPKKIQRIMEELSLLTCGSVEKLKFFNRSLESYAKIPLIYKFFPPLCEIAFRKAALDDAEKITPGSYKKVKQLMRAGMVSRPHPYLWHAYRYRGVFFSVTALILIWGMGTAVAALLRRAEPIGKAPTVQVALSHQALTAHLAPDLPDLNSTVAVPTLFNSAPAGAPFRQSRLQAKNESKQQPKGIEKTIPKYKSSSRALEPTSLTAMSAYKSDPATKKALPSTQPPTENSKKMMTTAPAATDEIQTYWTSSPQSDSTRKRVPEELINRETQPPIWLIEEKDHQEIYSNRLIIHTEHAVNNIPRKYYRFKNNSSHLPERADTSNHIAGILYHASESDLLPLTPEMNNSLLKYSGSLLRYIVRARSYNYFIDRFGRVFRIVREKDAAFHAGNAIWADDNSVFLNLNHAFLGICFEGSDFEEIHSPQRATAVKTMRPSSINESQIKSGRELTDWLRTKYQIKQHNCIPHGLASINPKNCLIGYHLDLSHGFPFHRFGLSNKYLQPLPAITEFGFTHDRYLSDIFGGSLWPGIALSESHLQIRAKVAGLSARAYRKRLTKRFTKLYQWQKAHETASQANSNHSPPPSG